MMQERRTHMAKTAKKHMSNQEFVKKLGGGEKAIRTMLDYGVTTASALRRVILLNINSLLQAGFMLSKECEKTLAAERDSIINGMRKGHPDIMKDPVAEAIDEINNILFQSKAGLVFGLLTGLRIIKTEEDAKREKKYGKTVAVDVVEQLKGMSKREIKKRIRRSR
jgi:hypothetical protein